MLNANPIGVTVVLAASITKYDTQFRVREGTAVRIDPGSGNHVWVTLRNEHMQERVKVVSRTGDVLTVEGRGGDGTMAVAWPVGTCVKVEWNPAQLCEFVQNCMANAPAPTAVDPGTYCLSACTCIDVAADGRITKITGEASC